MFLSFSHLSLVTCLATRECFDLMMGKLLGITSLPAPLLMALDWNEVITFRVSSMILSTGRLLATICLAVPRSSITTKAFLAIPSSASNTPYFLEIFPDRSARRGILHLPSRPPSAFEALTKALWEYTESVDMASTSQLSFLKSSTLLEKGMMLSAYTKSMG